MTAAKQKLAENLKEHYVLDGNFSEEYVQKHNKPLFKLANEVYGDWQKALRNNQISKRKIREREKFVLYCMMKNRYEKWDKEALRNKNVLPVEIKDRIVDVYKTMKTLKDVIFNWSEERVLYELHAYFLKGGTFEQLEEDEPTLYENMLEYFQDLNHLVQQYDRRFGMPTIDPEHLVASLQDELEPIQVAGNENEEVLETVGEAPVPVENSFLNGDLEDILVKLNYIEKDDIQHLKEATHISKEDISTYLFSMLAQVKMQDKKLTDNMIKEDDASMFFAIKAQYGDLKTAVQALTASLLDFA